MIVTDVTDLGRVATPMGTAIQWRCLARRGMIHSECEAVDYLELPPGATVAMDGRCGTEEAWYVLDGHAEFHDPGAGYSHYVGAGHLALRPAAMSPIVRNVSSDTSLRLLLIVVLPQTVSDRLPHRSPVADRNVRS